MYSVRMMKERTSRQDLIAAYFAHHAAARDKRSVLAEELFWAWEQVRERVAENPAEGWALTHDLLLAAPDDDALMYVAAGPLEDLLKRAGESVIDDVITAARRDAKVRRALRGVWGRSGMKPHVVAEIERILGPVGRTDAPAKKSRRR
jgi:hypothetical protein